MNITDTNLLNSGLLNWLTPQWITAIIAIIAFIVAILNLWFATLKGPDIVFVQKPEGNIKIKPLEFSDRYIPYEIKSDLTQLIFINNGTRSGVVGFTINFEPSKEVNSFYKKSIIKLGHKLLDRYDFIFDSETGENSPISIAERESGIIDIFITIQFYDWKKYFDSLPVSKNKICEVLSRADNNNYQRFSNFCSDLNSSMVIGKININTTQTIRKHIFWTKMEEKNLVNDLQVGPIDQKFFDGFKAYLDKWNDINQNYIFNRIPEIKALLPEILTHLRNRLWKVIHSFLWLL